MKNIRELIEALRFENEYEHGMKAVQNCNYQGQFRAQYINLSNQKLMEALSIAQQCEKELHAIEIQSQSQAAMIHQALNDIKNHKSMLEAQLQEARQEYENQKRHQRHQKTRSIIRTCVGLALGAFFAPILVQAMATQILSMGYALLPATTAGLQGAVSGGISAIVTRDNVAKAACLGGLTAIIGNFGNSLRLINPTTTFAKSLVKTTIISVSKSLAQCAVTHEQVGKNLIINVVCDNLTENPEVTKRTNLSSLFDLKASKELQTIFTELQRLSEKTFASAGMNSFISKQRFLPSLTTALATNLSQLAGSSLAQSAIESHYERELLRAQKQAEKFHENSQQAPKLPVYSEKQRPTNVNSQKQPPKVNVKFQISPEKPTPDGDKPDRMPKSNSRSQKYKVITFNNSSPHLADEVSYPIETSIPALSSELALDSVINDKFSELHKFEAISPLALVAIRGKNQSQDLGPRISKLNNTTTQEVGLVRKFVRKCGDVSLYVVDKGKVYLQENPRINMLIQAGLTVYQIYFGITQSIFCKAVLPNTDLNPAHDKFASAMGTMLKDIETSWNMNTQDKAAAKTAVIAPFFLLRMKKVTPPIKAIKGHHTPHIKPKAIKFTDATDIPQRKVKIKNLGIPEDQLSDVGRYKPEKLNAKELATVLEWQQLRNTYLKNSREFDVGTHSKTTQKLLQFNKADENIKRHMTPDDLAGILKEERGVIITDKAGYIKFHKQEWRHARNGLKNHIIALQKGIDFLLAKGASEHSLEVKLLIEKLRKICKMKDNYANLTGIKKTPNP